MKKRYRENGYYFIQSNDYDLIIQYINEYMQGIRVVNTVKKHSFERKLVKHIIK